MKTIEDTGKVEATPLTQVYRETNTLDNPFSQEIDAPSSEELRIVILQVAFQNPFEY
jgi:hypothetical protein